MNQLITKNNQKNFSESFVSTSIGDIFINIREIKDTMPLVLLHGVYFDHHLWDKVVSQIKNTTIVTIDMPLHGKSKNIKKVNWTVDDCAIMLIEILDALNFEKVNAIGHSWGSQTILRSAINAPERFQSVGFCNIPFEAATFKSKFQFTMQHQLLPFRNFYTKQVAKAIYGKKTLLEKPELMEYLFSSMSSLSNKEIKQTDRAVIMNAINVKKLIDQVNGTAFAIKGIEDYVPAPKPIPTTLVQGGHVSPLESPEEVLQFVRRIIERK